MFTFITLANPSRSPPSSLANPESRDMFGMIISYTVKVKLYLGAMGGEVTAELPFVLMHPKVSLLARWQSYVYVWVRVEGRCGLVEYVLMWLCTTGEREPEAVFCCLGYYKSLS